MEVAQIKDYCLSVPRAYKTRLANTCYFKIEDRIFAILDDDDEPRLTFRCDPEEAQQLRTRYNWVLPGYHINEEHWNTIYCQNMDWDLVKEWLTRSHTLAEKGIRQRRRPLAVDAVPVGSPRA